MKLRCLALIAAMALPAVAQTPQAFLGIKIGVALADSMPVCLDDNDTAVCSQRSVLKNGAVYYEIRNNPAWRGRGSLSGDLKDGVVSEIAADFPPNLGSEVRQELIERYGAATYDAPDKTMWKFGMSTVALAPHASPELGLLIFAKLSDTDLSRLKEEEPVPAQNGTDFDIRAVASRLEKSIEACPRREVVVAFDGAHHKQDWEKNAWGPPTQVFADVRANDSILYPYILTVEFYLRMTFGPERKTKAEAEADTELHVSPIAMAMFLGTKYRNVYLVSKDEIRLKSTLVLNNKLLNTGGDNASSWGDRPVWPDACWDHVR